MSRLVHAEPTESSRWNRFPCGAARVWERGSVEHTLWYPLASRVTCEACKRALQQREAG